MLKTTYDVSNSDRLDIEYKISDLIDVLLEESSKHPAIVLGEFFLKHRLYVNAEIAISKAKMMQIKSHHVENMEIFLYQRSAWLRAGPFYAKKFVITGELEFIDRQTALQTILYLGGEVSNSPVNTMDCLIMGYQEWSEYNGGIATRKAQKAVDLIRKGKDIKIFDEGELKRMIEGMHPEPQYKVEA